MEWLLELALVGLLLATLFHAVRLERALGVLKRDRAALEELVAGFNQSTRAAEHGIERLRDAADGAGRQIARQVDTATRLKDDLVFLTERGDTLADRLDQMVRDARSLAEPPPRLRAIEPIGTGHGHPSRHPENGDATEVPAPRMAADDPGPRVRSQAERDLIRALRMAR